MSGRRQESLLQSTFNIISGGSEQRLRESLVRSMDIAARKFPFELSRDQIMYMADISQPILADFQSDDLLESTTRTLPIIHLTRDRNFSYAFLPDTIRLNPFAELTVENILNYKNIRVVRLPLSPQDQERYVFKRAISSSTAWNTSESPLAEGGRLWEIFINPHELAVPDPTIRSKSLIIQNIITGPLYAYPWLYKGEDHPDFLDDIFDMQEPFAKYIPHEQYLRYRILHESAHIDEMNVRPWVDNSDVAFPDVRRLEKFNQLLELYIDRLNLREILSIHQEHIDAKKVYNLPRGYIGELYAYLTEIYFLTKFAQYHHSQNDVQQLIHDFITERVAPLEKHNQKRSKENYPVMDKSKYALLVVAKIFVNTDNLDGEKLKFFLRSIKDLMRE